MRCVHSAYYILYRSKYARERTTFHWALEPSSSDPFHLPLLAKDSVVMVGVKVIQYRQCVKTTMRKDVLTHPQCHPPLTLEYPKRTTKIPLWQLMVNLSNNNYPRLSIRN